MSDKECNGQDVGGYRARCCGPGMGRLMRAFFTGSCAEKMEEIMKDCSGFAPEREKRASENESAVD